MIVVEGPDGAGKTTLVTELLRRFPGMELGERGTADRSKLYTVTRSDTYRAISRACDAQHPLTLWDRLFYSELVYAELVGRLVEFTPVEQQFVRRMVDALLCPVILCLPPLDVVVANARSEREQMAGVKDNIRDIYESYVQLLRDEVFPQTVMLYDYTGTNELSADDGFPTYADLAEVDRDIMDYVHERDHRKVAA